MSVKHLNGFLMVFQFRSKPKGGLKPELKPHSNLAPLSLAPFARNLHSAGWWAKAAQGQLLQARMLMEEFFSSRTSCRLGDDIPDHCNPILDGNTYLLKSILSRAVIRVTSIWTKGTRECRRK